ncbi:hypothetical protein [Alicyclobacillus mengziensis]|uniref:hypothetical protein n=1 Tax=Alicyclobacillus mengziensis TaxID=2931921 RepID=UPI003204BF56
MSQANIPSMTPTISLSLGQSITMLLDSIALEELALAHLMNAEAEKTEMSIGTLVGAVSLSPTVVTVTDLQRMNKSVRATLQDVINKEILLEFKFENVLSIVSGGGLRCPLTRGKTRGFWQSNPGHAILDPNNTNLLSKGPVTLGIVGTDFRSVTVEFVSNPTPGSDTVNSDDILKGNYCSLAGSNCGSLSDNLQSGTLETLMAQTLALTYNIEYIPCYSGQTVAELGCAGFLDDLSLSPDSTVNDVLNLANSLIANSLSGGTTTQSQAGAMNSLLGDCLNQE